jgi:dihydrofolate reductase
MVVTDPAGGTGEITCRRNAVQRTKTHRAPSPTVDGESILLTSRKGDRYGGHRRVLDVSGRLRRAIGRRVEHIFDWYFAGDVEVPTAAPGMVFHTSEASARHIREGFARIGALVSGRRLFDITNGWNGTHPIGVPVVVVSHTVPEEWRAEHADAPFTFVGDVETAIATAKQIDGDKDVAVAGPNVVQQCLNLGLMDEIAISLVPVLIGEGISYFGDLVKPPVKLEGPRIIEGAGVTHLYYKVKKND